jgi:hypothetical protein
MYEVELDLQSYRTERSRGAELDSAPDAHDSADSAMSILLRYWYLLLVPVGVFALLKLDGLRGGRKTKRYGGQ